jgi:hypothetical protein
MSYLGLAGCAKLIALGSVEKLRCCTIPILATDELETNCVKTRFMVKIKTRYKT